MKPSIRLASLLSLMSVLAGAQTTTQTWPLLLKCDLGTAINGADANGVQNARGTVTLDFFNSQLRIHEKFDGFPDHYFREEHHGRVNITETSTPDGLNYTVSDFDFPKARLDDTSFVVDPSGKISGKLTLTDEGHTRSYKNMDCSPLRTFTDEERFSAQFIQAVCLGNVDSVALYLDSRRELDINYSLDPELLSYAGASVLGCATRNSNPKTLEILLGQDRYVLDPNVGQAAQNLINAKADSKYLTQISKLPGFDPNFGLPAQLSPVYALTAWTKAPQDPSDLKGILNTLNDWLGRFPRLDFATPAMAERQNFLMLLANNIQWGGGRAEFLSALLELLKAHRADLGLNQVDRNGLTLAHYLAQMSWAKPDHFELIRSWNPEWNMGAADASGHTALDYALKQNNANLVTYLRKFISSSFDLEAACHAGFPQFKALVDDLDSRNVYWGPGVLSEVAKCWRAMPNDEGLPFAKAAFAAVNSLPTLFLESYLESDYAIVYGRGPFPDLSPAELGALLHARPDLTWLSPPGLPDNTFEILHTLYWADTIRTQGGFRDQAGIRKVFDELRPEPVLPEHTLLCTPPRAFCSSSGFTEFGTRLIDHFLEGLDSPGSLWILKPERASRFFGFLDSLPNLAPLNIELPCSKDSCEALTPHSAEDFNALLARLKVIEAEKYQAHSSKDVGSFVLGGKSVLIAAIITGDRSFLKRLLSRPNSLRPLWSDPFSYKNPITLSYPDGRHNRVYAEWLAANNVLHLMLGVRDFEATGWLMDRPDFVIEPDPKVATLTRFLFTAPGEYRGRPEENILLKRLLDDPKLQKENISLKESDGHCRVLFSESGSLIINAPVIDALEAYLKASHSKFHLELDKKSCSFSLNKIVP